MDKFVSAAKGLPISFPGFIPPRSFFDQIDCLIVPSIWPEPLPRTILESYAAGVPSIGARSGGIPDLIGFENNDWLFEPDKASELADRMMRVITIGRGALPTREDFSAVLSETTPQLVARRYQALYNEVLGSRRRASP
jgi:glycosyltransferase involved in cell wall biosynthesis